MLNFLMTAFVALLFVAFTPGMFFTFPTKGSKFIIALFHGTIFALVLHFTYRIVRRLTGSKTEGFDDDVTSTSDDSTPPPPVAPRHGRHGNGTVGVVKHNNNSGPRRVRGSPPPVVEDDTTAADTSYAP